MRANSPATTYIQTKRDGWCYLSTIMDLHSRRIIGYSFSKKIDTKLIMKVLESAVQNRTITEDLIIHSDLGTQFSVITELKQMLAA